MPNLKTVLDWIRYACSEFNRHEVYYGHGTNHALDEAAALVLGILRLPYDLNPIYFQARLSQEEHKILAEALQRRIEERVPVPYLTQRTLYGGLEFYIDERALIPRSPIAEYLANEAAGSASPRRILDLCCGSGCIGLLAQSYFPHAELVLSDIDAEALQVAAINLKRFQLEDEVQLVQGDGFENVDGLFDLILCNPPYVEEAEEAELPPEYHHEPRQALYSGADGLNLTRRIVREAADYLTDDGILILEVGMSWPHLEEALADCGLEWLEFKNGGEGVCRIHADELKAWKLAGLLDDL